MEKPEEEEQQRELQQPHGEMLVQQPIDIETTKEEEVYEVFQNTLEHES